jgi:tetratricopeptide (TPR) repeat protein
MEERVVKKHPMDLGARINLGRLYNIYAGYSDEPLSYYKKAEAVELEALDLSPFREQVYFELGQTYVLMGDFEKGSHYYKLALELAPTIAVSNYYYGMSLYSWSKGLKAQGDVDAATEKLNEAVAYIDKAVAHNYLFLASVGDLKNISNVYLEAERYDSMAVALTELLKRNPKDMAIVAQLAMAYKAAGNNEKAREAAEIMRRASDRPEDIQWTEAFLRTVQ